MKQAILIVTSCFISICSMGQSYSALVQKADSLYKIKEYKLSVQEYEQAFRHESRNGLHLYNAACSAALAGTYTKAFGWLHQAVDNGWSSTPQYEHLQKDPDLVGLHKQKGWAELLEKARLKATQMEAYYQPVKEELLQILKDDQEPMKAFHATKDEQKRDSIKKAGMALQAKNVIKLKTILDKYGWLGMDKVGPQANSAYFFVIQHADQATQEQYLPLMQQAVTQGNALPSQLAYVEDRVALRQGRKQRYGSQVGQDEKTGRPYVLPLEDPDHVDQRRQSVGLPPLAEYLKGYGVTWDVEEYKKLKLPEGKKDWKF